MNIKCAKCDTNGVCIACKSEYETLANGKCTCNKIASCEDCTYDSKKCTKCVTGKIVNEAVNPNTCVSSCPSGTHLSNGVCKAGSNVIELIKNERNFDYYNPLIHSNISPLFS